ncbi:hypothetical protein [Paenibacillus sp. GbtcB18]|uniref:hypothetical protein n=1 Tax=Paenibacillus sp. GbtcB18 TaxID=2824763 RepID=UPI001C2F7B8F|nr:hypothetical protein [Paenibacillus sp. GbtcB18]
MPRAMWTGASMKRVRRIGCGIVVPQIKGTLRHPALPRADARRSGAVSSGP